MSVNRGPEATLVNIGRGKVYSPMRDNTKTFFHTDPQFHNGLNNGPIHYPSTTHVVLPPHSTTFISQHKTDNFWKTSGDDTYLLTQTYKSYS